MKKKKNQKTKKAETLESHLGTGGSQPQFSTMVNMYYIC